MEVVIAGEERSGGSLLVAAEVVEALSSDGVGWDDTARSKTKSELREISSEAASRPYLSGRKGELPAVRLDP